MSPEIAPRDKGEMHIFLVHNKSLSSTPAFMLTRRLLQSSLWQGLFAGLCGAGHRTRGLELPAPPPQTSGEGRGAGNWIQSPLANDAINRIYVKKPQKTPKGWGFEKVGEHTCRLGGWPTRHGTEALPLSLLCTPFPSGCYWITSFITIWWSSK